jgi:hypothetical protein
LFSYSLLCCVALWCVVLCRRYAEFVASIITMQGSSAVGSSGASGELPDDLPSDSLGIGGGGELMLQQDLGLIRVEMISEYLVRGGD